MSNIIGIRNNNTIVPYTAATKRTKQLDIKADVTYNVGGETTGWTFTAVYAIFYADSLGNWRMRFNLRLLRDTGSVAVTSATITFTNITNFQITQGIIGSLGAVTAVLSVASGSTKNLTLNLASTTVNILYASGDVMLSSEPTIYTTAANMEGVTAVDVYIPPASAGIQGLINNLSSNIYGTPIKGRTDGNYAITGDVGEEKQFTPSVNISTNTSTYTEIGSLLLTDGVWLVSATMVSDNRANQTGFLTKLQILGVLGSTWGDDYIPGNNAAGSYSCATFTQRRVVVSPSTSDKSIKIFGISVGADGYGRAKINALRIQS